MTSTICNIRRIEKKDDKQIAEIIRNVFREFKIDRPGTAVFDSCLDYMSDYYSAEKSIYYVCEYKQELIGGAGIYPSEGFPESYCELVKMYLHQEARGLGIAKTLLEYCISFARNTGYRYINLETLRELVTAIQLYNKCGFQYVQKPLGNCSHNSCQIRMVKKIQ